MTFGLALLVAGPVMAQERRYWVESFHSEIEVLADGSLDVTERLTFAFEGSFNGVYRDIPWRYRTPWGLDYELRITPLQMLGPDGQTLRSETGKRGSDFRFKVWVPGAENAERVVTLRYHVERGLRFFDRGEEGFESPRDELYWNVTGDRWEVPIRRASARVTLPEGVADGIRTRVFLGAYGATGDEGVVVQSRGREILFRAGEGVEAGEGLTVVVGWPQGAVQRPTWTDDARYLLADNWPLLIPVFALVAMFFVHRLWGRDLAVDRSVMVQYEPPSGYRPAELGTLIDERVDLRDVVATVIDLGVRGYLRIEEATEDGWFRDTTKTRLIKLRPADGELRGYERTVLEGLFESGDDVALDDLQAKFYSRLDDIKTALYGGLTDAGLFRGRPDRVRMGWIILAVVTVPILVVAGIFTQRAAFFFAAPATALIIGIFGWFMPARTRTGRRMYLELRGFEEFLGRTDKERLRALDLPSTIFEQYLPHAMALGVATHWAAAFADLVRRPPEWYRGGDGAFNTVIFANHMNGLNSRMGTALASQPRSSGGGSSGGSGFSGGFSGGGFGGGGGGAF